MKKATATTKNSKQQKKSTSRNAARSRRGQQNDGYSDLANQLPLPLAISGQLDRLCVMRLVNSYIKMKQLMDSVTNQDASRFVASDEQPFDKSLLEALDGFVFVVTSNGQCLHVSDNITKYMGLAQTDVCGNSLYKYVHPCDHEELASQLGGQIPLEDVEIFDGLFCSESVFVMNNLLKGGSKHKQAGESPYKSFSLRMKSTLTSRGKSVNLKASTYRVVHCTGCMKMKTTVNADGTAETTPDFLIAIGVPLMVASNFEVPLDRSTFTTRHSLDMKILSCDDKMQNLLGYSPVEMIGKSWYNFQHGCDLDTVLACHKSLLTKGQSVSKYYRFLVRDGGWVWLQTKANVVYDSKTCQPQFILCINYLLGKPERKECVLSLEQINPVLLSGGLSKSEQPLRSPDSKRKHSICLEERIKVLKAASSNQKHRGKCVVKTQPIIGKENRAKFEETRPQENAPLNEINFQDCFPVVWDDSEFSATQAPLHETGLTNTPVPSPATAENNRTPAIPSPEEDEVLQYAVGTVDDDGKNFDERAPFIPLPEEDDAGSDLNSELLAELPFLDSPVSPFSWLMDDDISFDKDCAAPFTSQPAFPPAKQSPGKASTLPGKAVLLANQPPTSGKFLPVLSEFDAQVNAPVEDSSLLEGMDLFRALELANPI